LDPPLLQKDPPPLPSLPLFYFDADPNPAFPFDADPDPVFYLDIDPIPVPASQNDPDPQGSKLNSLYILYGYPDSIKDLTCGLVP
jgi:hypothetical protein